MNWFVTIVVAVAAIVGCRVSYEIGKDVGAEGMRKMMTSYIDSDSMFV